MIIRWMLAVIFGVCLGQIWRTPDDAAGFLIVALVVLWIAGMNTYYFGCSKCKRFKK